MGTKDLLPYAGAEELARLKHASQPTITPRPQSSGRGGSSIRVFPRPLPQPRYTRIDFFAINIGIALGLKEIKWGWRVSKYIDGWTAGTAPHTVEDDPPMRSADGTQEPFDIDKALAHLAAHGWTVHRWHSGLSAGARAWLGTPLPVRNREQIHRMRSALTRHLITTQGHTEISTQVDLAFDY